MSCFEPVAGVDRVLLFTKANLVAVMTRRKVVDVRKVNYKPGKYLLGCNGYIYGVAQVNRKAVVVCDRSWDRLRHSQTGRHLPLKMPYTPKTCVFDITVLKQFDPPCSYQHQRGAVNICIYRP